MSITLAVFVGTFLLVGALIALLIHVTRATDEQVAAFDPVIRTMLRAEPVAGDRGSWRVHDVEHRLQATIELARHSVSVSFAPLGHDVEAQLRTSRDAPYASWSRDSDTGVFAADEPSGDDEDDANTPWLEQRLTPTVAAMPVREVWAVTAMPPMLDVSIDPDDTEGGAAARTTARAYPALRDWYLRARPLLEQVPADADASAVSATGS